ncbi:Hsp33 family molecular chaperone HslO [Mesomycoplasma neurolyticum]|uniref:Heat shock protein 33 homolog n=1 Tax=Mesomycoplasma neurolyticum TaxID=2120 RepID=A0A449A638_9BACT|nr:Hsp33 family molecular chaperone HslO [Mesomycoplasma neurolyticum]VEU59721.1 Heat shock protein 33 homolog [Mesomycoplasma neurolyticum]
MSFSKIFIKNNVRIFLSDFTDVVNYAVKKHKTANFSSLILAEAMVTLGVLSFILQSKHGKIVSFIKSSGAIKNIIVETNSNGEIKALVGNPNIEIVEKEYKNENIPLILAIGSEGILRVTRENKFDIFTSEVKLVKSDLITDLAYYFQSSEQIFTAIKTSVKFLDQNSFEKVYSVIFQLLPGHQEEDILWVENFIENNNLNNLTFNEYENKLNSTFIEIKKIKWHCNCSRQKLFETIQSIDKKELEKILIEDGKIEVICHFCANKYIFQKKDFENETFKH